MTQVAQPFPSDPMNACDIARIENYEIIYNTEHPFEDEDDEDLYLSGQYLLGISFYDSDYNYYLLAATIKPRTYFSYQFDSIVDYLNNYSILFQDRLALPEILQLHIDENSVYQVTVKTFWLRLVQRTWKNVIKKRRQILTRNGGNTLHYLRNRELGHHKSTIPTLQGMLYPLKQQYGR